MSAKSRIDALQQRLGSSDLVLEVLFEWQQRGGLFAPDDPPPLGQATFRELVDARVMHAAEAAERGTTRLAKKTAVRRALNDAAFLSLLVVRINSLVFETSARDVARLLALRSMNQLAACSAAAQQEHPSGESPDLHALACNEWAADELALQAAVRDLSERHFGCATVLMHDAARSLEDRRGTLVCAADAARKLGVPVRSASELAALGAARAKRLAEGVVALTRADALLERGDGDRAERAVRTYMLSTGENG